MTTSISLNVYRPTGGLVRPNLPLYRLEWWLQDLAFGRLVAAGSMDSIDPAIFKPDAPIAIMRSVNNSPAYLEGDTAFLLRYWRFVTDASGRRTWEIEAYAPEYLMTGRIIDSWASQPDDINPLTTKSGAADDIIKELVTENMVSSTTAIRNLPNLTVEADLSAAQVTDKSCSYDKLFDACVDLCLDSNALGTYLTFGMLLNPETNALTLRTWTGQRGTDRTEGKPGAVVVSHELKTLAEAATENDYRAEVTAVRAGGAGIGAARTTARVVDDTRATASPYAYREDFYNASSNSETTDTLTAAARTELEDGRAVKTFSGRFVDTDYARYGDRVRFGDLVTAKHESTFTCRVDRVHGIWTGVETLEIDLSGVEGL